MSTLETRLTALGAALDHPEGEELVARVARDLALHGSATAAHSVRPSSRLTSRPALRSSRRVHALIAVAVAIVVSGAFAVEPSRRAIADLFRIGGVEVRDASDLTTSSSTPTSSTPETSTSGPSRLPAGNTPIAAAQAMVDFPIRVPALVPSRAPTVSADPTVPGGLVTLDYGDFRVVEVAARPGQTALVKGIDERTRITPTSVGTTTGYWFTGTHHVIAYLDREGAVRRDTVREVGHVLLWVADGITFRVEGFERLAGALEIARTLP